MDALTTYGFAKVNLCLDITGVDDKGWHFLDTIIAEIPIYDKVVLFPRADKEITIRYENGISFKDDVAVKMAKKIVSKYDTSGVDIIITKNIPLSAGIGGSSADAAGVARGMSVLFQLGDIDNEVLRSVGSDVPALFRGGINRVSGLGEIVKPVELPSNLYVSLILCDKEHISTKEVYKLYDTVGGKGGRVSTFLKNLKPFNALEKAAKTISSVVDESRKMLTSAGYKNVTMTGSGSGVIGYTTSREEDEVFVQKLKDALPGSKRSLLSFKIMKS